MGGGRREGHVGNAGCGLSDWRLGLRKRRMGSMDHGLLRVHDVWRLSVWELMSL